MKKTLFTFILAMAVFYGGTLRAEHNAGFGIHFGMHQNVGNYKSNDSSVLVDPQNNFLYGISLKLNALCFFARTGIDFTYLMNKGKVLEDPANNIQSYNIQYRAIPFFLGFNYQILDTGNFYMGPGGAYIMGRGKMSYSDSSLSKKINTSAWGIGFISGLELSLSDAVRFYFEWEYLDGRALSVQQTQTTDNWKDLYIDYTGSRIMAGVIYYVL